MVWKKLIKNAALSVLLASALQAGAQTVQASVYTEGNISSTYTTIFQDILDGCNPLDDYVFYRSGNYEYKMYVGDLDLNENIFTGNDLECYTLSYSQSGYNNSIYSYNTTTGHSIYLNASNYLLYSNLGNYPTLVERGDFVVTLQIFLLVLISLCCLIRPIFNFTWRKR